MPTGRPHPPEFKAKVVMQVISGEKTLNDVATEYDLNPKLVRKWRNKFEQEAYRVIALWIDCPIRAAATLARNQSCCYLPKSFVRLECRTAKQTLFLALPFVTTKTNSPMMQIEMTAK